MAEREKIENFYRLWTSEVDGLLSGYIYDEEGNPNPTLSGDIDIMYDSSAGGADFVLRIRDKTVKMPLKFWLAI